MIVDENIKLPLKLSKTKIKEGCLKCLKEYGFTVTDEQVGNGYFVFDLGQNSVVHFKLKEIPYWKFGLWIIKEAKEKIYTVQFFGEKIDWINKFKPGQTTISSSEYALPLVLTKKNLSDYSSIDMAVFSQLETLQRLKKNRRIAEYGLSGTNRSFIKWLFGEIWFYDIRKPLEKFLVKYIVGKLYKIIVKYIALRFRKYVKARPVIDNGAYSWPRYTTGVEYLNIEDESTYDVWHKIEGLKILGFLNKYSNFIHYKNSEDRRGFYYPEYNKKEN